MPAKRWPHNILIISKVWRHLPVNRDINWNPHVCFVIKLHPNTALCLICDNSGRWWSCQLGQAVRATTDINHQGKFCQHKQQLLGKYLNPTFILSERTFMLNMTQTQNVKCLHHSSNPHAIVAFLLLYASLSVTNSLYLTLVAERIVSLQRLWFFHKDRIIQTAPDGPVSVMNQSVNAVRMSDDDDQFASFHFSSFGMCPVCSAGVSSSALRECLIIRSLKIQYRT